MLSMQFHSTFEGEQHGDTETPDCEAGPAAAAKSNTSTGAEAHGRKREETATERHDRDTRVTTTGAVAQWKRDDRVFRRRHVRFSPAPTS